MRTNIIAALFAAGMAFATPVAAATIITGADGPTIGLSANDFVGMSDETVTSAGEYTFTYTALEDLKISEFGVSVNGTVADLGLVTVNLDFLAPPAKALDIYGSVGVYNFADFELSAGSSFTLSYFVSDDPSDALLISASFVTDVSEVPLPASLPLMLAALGGSGFMLKRRRKDV